MKSSLMITACLLILLLLTPSFAKANGKDNALAGSRGDEIRKGAVSGSQGRHLNADDSIRDLLTHPAFAGFARLLLPWDGRRYDESMRLSDIGSFLLYHSHVDPGTVVGALNCMIRSNFFSLMQRIWCSPRTHLTEWNSLVGSRFPYP